MKQTVKEAPSEVGPGQGKRTDLDEPSAIGTKLKHGSNSATYLTSRLKRDAPDIAKRLEKGEFKSVRKAAIEAGIVIVPSVLEQAKRAFLKLSDLDRKTAPESNLAVLRSAHHRTSLKFFLGKLRAATLLANAAILPPGMVKITPRQRIFSWR